MPKSNMKTWRKYFVLSWTVIMSNDKPKEQDATAEIRIVPRTGIIKTRS